MAVTTTTAAVFPLQKTLNSDSKYFVANNVGGVLHSNYYEYKLSYELVLLFYYCSFSFSIISAHGMSLIGYHHTSLFVLLFSAVLTLD